MERGWKLGVLFIFYVIISRVIEVVIGILTDERVGGVIVYGYVRFVF